MGGPSLYNGRSGTGGAWYARPLSFPRSFAIPPRDLARAYRTASPSIRRKKPATNPKKSSIPLTNTNAPAYSDAKILPRFSLLVNAQDGLHYFP